MVLFGFQVLSYVIVVYLGCGFLFYMITLYRSIGELDSVFRRTSILLKLFILPGMCILWPWLIKKEFFT